MVFLMLHCINFFSHQPFLPTLRLAMTALLQGGKMHSNIGEQNGHVKLNPAKVAEIRQDVLSGTRQVDVALKYGISQQQVSRIYSAQSWSHIPFPKEKI